MYPAYPIPSWSRELTSWWQEEVVKIVLVPIFIGIEVEYNQPIGATSDHRVGPSGPPLADQVGIGAGPVFSFFK
jgi:hypothetical protein